MRAAWEWIKRQWGDIKGNVKFALLLSVPAVIAGFIAVWHKLTWYELVGAGCAFASGWAIAVAALVSRSTSNVPKLVIKYAGYGLDSARLSDVTIALRGYIKDNRINVPITNHTFGTDPYPGQRKVLIVRYSVGRGMDLEVVRHENDQLVLPDVGSSVLSQAPTKLSAKAFDISKQLSEFLAEHGDRPSEDAIWNATRDRRFIDEYRRVIEPWDDKFQAGYWRRFKERVLSVRHELAENRLVDQTLDDALMACDTRPEPHHVKAIVERIRYLASQLED